MSQRLKTGVLFIVMMHLGMPLQDAEREAENRCQYRIGALVD
jgi:hypothetical protein